MSEFLAEAQIVVRANTKPFVADFEKAVKKVENTRVTVTVRASMTGFRNDLVTKLAASTKDLVVRPLVRADMTGFPADLQAKLLRSTKGVIATVGVKAGAVTQGAAAGAAGAAAGGGARRTALTAEQALTKAVEAGAFARQRVTGLIDDQDKRLVRLTRQEAAIKAAQELGAKAVAEGNGPLQARAVLIEKAARAEKAVTEGAFAKEQARRVARDPKVKEESTKAAETAAKKEIQLADDVVVASRQADRNLSDAKIANRQKEVERLLKIEKTGLDRQTAQRISAQNAIQKRLENIQVDIGGIDEAALAAGAGREGALRKQITTLTTAEKDAKKLLKDANLAGLTTEAAVIKGLVTQTSELKRLGTESLEAAKKQTKLAHTFANVRRAVVAQVASITGLRGAALTAASAFIATSAAVISLKKAVDLAAKIESRLAVFKVTAGATAEEMDRVHEKAIELGKDITLPAVSASDATIALTELSKAGLSVKDSMDGARGVLQLATAADINFEQATLLAANALNAFGLAGAEAGHVADVLANSANQSQGSIVDVGVALQQSSAVIRQAGLSLEEGVAALTLFARSGLRGSDAGTSLRTALIRLINPSAKAAEVIKRLGLRVRDASGAIDLTVFQQFTDATADLTAAQRDQALAIIFGQDAIRGAAILAREGTAGLAAQAAAINKTGTAAEVAGARTSGYAGSVENLKNQIEALAEEIGAALLPTLTGTVNLLADLTGLFGELTASVKQAVGPLIDFASVDIGGVRVGVLDVIGPFQKVRLAIKGASFAMRALEGHEAAVEFKLVKVEVDTLIKSLNKVGDAIALHATIVRLTELSTELKNGDERARAYAEDLDKFIKKLQDVPQTDAGELKFKVELPGELSLAGEKVGKQVGRGMGDSASESFGDSFTNPAVRRAYEAGAKAKVAFNQSVRATTGDGGRATENFRAGFKNSVIKTSEEAGTASSKRFEQTITVGSREAGEAASAGFANTFISSVAETGATGGDVFKQNFLAHAKVNPSDLEEAFGIVPLQPTNFGAGAFFQGFFDKFVQGHADAAEAARKQITEENKKTDAVIAGKSGRVSGLERAGLDLELAGAGDSALLKNANAKIAAQLKVVATEEERRRQILENSGRESNEHLRAAKEKLKQFQDERKSLLESIKSDAEQAKADAKQKRDDADQALLDSLAVGDRPLERRAARAAGTPGLEDDRAVLIAQRKRNLEKIKLIRAGVKDQKKAADAIAALQLENINLTNDIDAKTKEITEDTLGLRVELAELRGDKDAIIRLLKQVVARARRRLREAIAAKQGVLAARIEYRKAIGDVRDIEQEQADELFGVLQQRIELAGLRGHEGEQLKIIDKAIANRRKEIKRLKGLGKATLGVQLEIEQLIDQREEIKKTADDADKGTTAFELLAAAAETFRATGGNLIGGNQPFAGAAGFTADIAQFLVKPKTTGKPLTPTGPTKGKLDLQDTELIAALDRLRVTIETQGGGKGNATTATPAGSPTSSARVDRSYWDAVQARKVTEGRIGP